MRQHMCCGSATRGVAVWPVQVLRTFMNFRLWHIASFRCSCSSTSGIGA